MITLSAAARTNISSLRQIQSDMQAAQLRLSTGKRVNSAADNPTAFFVSSQLSSTANGLNQLVSGIGTARTTLSAANQALTAIKSLIGSAKTLAQQARDTTTSFVKVAGSFGSALNLNSTIATTGGTATRFRAGDAITVSDGTTTATYTAANNDTVQTFLNAINNTAGLKIKASLNGGQIEFNATSNVNVTLGSTVAGTGTLASVVGLSNGTTNFTNNSARQSYAAQFDALRTQIDQTIQDAGVAGVNLLAGSSLSVKFNEKGTSALNLTGSNLSAASLGLAASVNQFQTDTDADAALANADAAFASLQAQVGILGSQENVINVREEFTKSMVTTLQAGADFLVSSDVNEDSALLLALQTRQQVATTSLSLTQSAETAALRLFGL